MFAPGASKWSQSPADLSAQSFWQMAEEEEHQASAQVEFWQTKVLGEIGPTKA